jgi:hypothetical protein
VYVNLLLFSSFLHCKHIHTHDMFRVISHHHE